MSLSQRMSFSTSHLFTKQQRQTVFTTFALGFILLTAIFFYGRGYTNLPSDDPAASLIGARYMYELGSSTFQNPLNPTVDQEFYSNLIGTEYPLHTVLTQWYFLTGAESVLTTTNIFIVGLFVFAGLMIYFLFVELTKSRIVSLIGVTIALFSRWYGMTFWTGHYAQILAYVLLPTIMFGLVKYEHAREFRWLILSFFLTILLFPIHSLSFLIAAGTLTSFVLVRIMLFNRRHRFTGILLVGYFALVILGLLTARIFSDPQRYFPLFSVEDVFGASLRQQLSLSFDVFLAIPLLLFGVYRYLLDRRFTLLLWFLFAYFMVNSGQLLFPFFQYRFNEFMSLPIIALGVAGLASLIQLLRAKSAKLALIIVTLALVIPLNVRQQVDLRNCHLDYCPGLNPVSILPEDYQAFRWAERETPDESLFIAVPKFGIYVPAVAVRSVEFPILTSKGPNAAYRVMTDASQQIRWENAGAIGADYIIWDGVFDRYQSTYKPYQAYNERFDDERYFELVYDKSGVRIYRVKS